MNEINKNQFHFTFGNKVNYHEDDYIIGKANKEAYDFIYSWPNWGDHRFSNVVYLQGSKSAGKTHLLYIWQKRSHSKILKVKDFMSDEIFDKINSRKHFIIEDVEHYLEFSDKLFHVINHIVDTRKYLVITSKYTPNSLNVALPDLRSRLLALNYIKIHDPDLNLLKSILFKHFADRQLRVNIEVINYILSRIDRSYDSVYKMINLIDQKSLEQKRNITIPFIKEL